MEGGQFDSADAHVKSEGKNSQVVVNHGSFKPILWAERQLELPVCNLDGDFKSTDDGDVNNRGLSDSCHCRAGKLSAACGEPK